MKYLQKSKLAKLIQGSLFSSLVLSGAAVAQGEEAGAESAQLEVIQVTARKRVENAQEVPVAVSALQGDNLDAYSSAGMDIRFMNAKIPSLSVESSFGRTFPRFYVRGLGNTDFDLNASQPVSLVVDDVVQESPILKGFPVFDVERVEVLRGPQGTLFGRNTPAGLVKFDSVKPSQEFEGYGALSYSTFNSVDFEGAVGGGLTDNLSARVSVLKQTRDDYIDNRAPNNFINDVTGGYDEQAARIQFLYEAGDFTALLNYHTRDLDGKPIVFHANAIEKGTNKPVAGFDPEVIYQDSVQFATQQVESQGSSLKLEYDFEDHTLTSITGWESAEIYSRADVDGGYGCGNDFVFGCPTPEMGPGFIFLASESADAIPSHDQISQEIRLASNFAGDFNYQVGAYYYNEEQTIETFGFDGLGGDFNWGYVFQEQDTTAWAVFASADYHVSDKLKVSGGLRYSDDKRDFRAVRLVTPGDFNNIDLEKSANPEDSHVSWDLSAAYKLTDDVNLFARAANSFRAPSVQGRILFGDEVTVADSETINSIEFGVKSDVLDGRGRVNATTYYFQMDDQQVTAVGGSANFNRLLNADKTVGYGLELDSEWILTDELFATFNISYNKTELQDNSLFLQGCFNCTITDPFVEGKGYSLDGNSLPHSPEWISNFTLRYSKEIGDGEFFAYTDWSYRSEIDFFLYESVEFEGEALLEGGIRSGYLWEAGDNEYEVSAFVRNITDEQVFIGGVDFSNNAAMVNQPRIMGVEFKVSFF
ncbi:MULTISPECIES: TonB-dependent receptor [unclassified Pseudoalteromonas]|uniref:TonB-dependent receptor n=1 Tax=unclassified Pseudoalteromonas TaxID=194690 RepID=UPI0006D5E942|nr:MULTISPECIES: TonB-dependent receptor [unclassified Pseudoalteromonas]KPV97615.1 Pesticin receptor precursor [Pseudoalteromonas sp. P1-9]MCF6457899.1 TonB-dependent receptor [Pseudoalteromonas sp. MMG024]